MSIKRVRLTDMQRYKLGSYIREMASEGNPPAKTKAEFLKKASSKLGFELKASALKTCLESLEIDSTCLFESQFQDSPMTVAFEKIETLENYVEVLIKVLVEQWRHIAQYNYCLGLIETKLKAELDLNIDLTKESNSEKAKIEVTKFQEEYFIELKEIESKFNES